MRAIAVADLHLRGDMKHNAVVADKLAWLSTTMKAGDVLVVLGDLTDDGKENQYKHALELLRPFSGRIVVVPGNHDFGRLGCFYDPKCVQRFAKLRVALGSDTPHLFRVDGFAVGEVIVLDSNLRTVSPVDFAQGKVGWWQRWRLRAKLDAMRQHRAISVVALHHSPLCTDWFLRLQDAKKFLDVVLGRADIVLCGHEHKLRTLHYPMNLPAALAQTRLYSAASLQYEGTEPLVVPLVAEEEDRNG